MADSYFDVLEIRFVFEPELTHAYVLCSAPSDGMIGVQGWHRGTFPPSVSALDIMHNDIARMEFLTGDRWCPAAPPR